MRAFKAICCVLRHVLSRYSVCQERLGKDSVCHCRGTQPQQPPAPASWRDNARVWRHVPGRHGYPSRTISACNISRYYATAIYSLSLPSNEFLGRRNVSMGFWSFMGNKRGTMRYSLAGTGKRSASPRWVIQVFPRRKLMGPDGKWPLDFDDSPVAKIPNLSCPCPISGVDFAPRDEFPNLPDVCTRRRVSRLFPEEIIRLLVFWLFQTRVRGIQRCI